MSAGTRFYRPELDALRFGAFFLVFLHHALPHASADYATWGLPAQAGQALAALSRAGALGVDLFFALSSYLITELLLREHAATGTLDVRAFYLRRILRIWPLYFFALFLLAPLMRFVAPDDEMPGGYMAAYALLAGNWACDMGGFPRSSFALLWSVSIEEQFCLFCPVAIRGRVAMIGRIAMAMLAAATLARVALAATGVTHPGVWTNTLARLDPIAGGALLAYTLRGRSPDAPRPLWAGAGFLVLLLVGGFGPRDGWGSVAAYPLAAAAAVAVLRGTVGMGGLGWLGYLGKISFGLYVYHTAALAITPNAVVGSVMTVAAAALSYRFLESPFLQLKERFARVPSRSV